MEPADLLSRAYAALAAGGRLEEAAALFAQALTVAPEDPRALTGRAITLRAAGHPAQAESLLRRATDLAPDHADAWAQLGTTLRILNRLPESGAALERALALVPDHAYARANLEVLSNLWRREGSLLIDYPPDFTVRQGHGKPAHPRLAAMLAAGASAYAQTAAMLTAIADDLAQIPDGPDPDRPDQPWWNNIWLPRLDAGVLCALLAGRHPARLLEIGSGMSTRFARWTIGRFATGTHLHSIDPEPRVEIDAICDQVTRAPLESCDLSLFAGLEAGDILFYDGSHRSFQNSDVTVFFTEVLPELKPGVIVQIHDIFLPYDYPPDWRGRIYNEQYLLAALLLAGQTRYDILWPGAFIPDLESVTSTLPPSFQGRGGGSFWLRVR